MSSTRITRTGLQLAIAIAASGAIAAPALAATSAQAGTGTYKTWAQAQHAAGFALLKPGVTYGLPNVGHVVVGVCEAPGKLKKRVVSVNYGSFATHSLALDQDNANGPCVGGYTGTSLGTYKVHGIRAQLYGYCNTFGAPPCSSTKIELWLTWKKKADYYIASSFNESRSRLEHFASDLKKA
jgi:hypothetical protein